MTRKLIALALLTWLTPIAKSQDMPLSQILIEGEGWRKVKGNPEKPQITYQARSHDGWLLSAARGGISGMNETGTTGFSSGGSSTKDVPRTTWLCFSRDDRTLFVAYENSRAIRSFTFSDQARISNGEDYCPLRVRRGEKGISVSSLATDKDGRIYAATEIGVQVFDPTGRLCGVLTPAATGKPELMLFDANQLTLWIGNTKYTRKLNTSGAK
jgi:SMP-30/Gluconolactonase/LRE-like region